MTFWVIDVDGDAAAVLAALPADAHVELVAVGGAPDAGALNRFAAARCVRLALDADTPLEAAAPEIVELVRAAPEDVVLGADSLGVRSLLGAVAAALGFPVVTDVREFRPGELVVGRFGGNTLQRVAARGVIGIASALFTLSPDERARGSVRGSAGPGEAGVSAAGAGAPEVIEQRAQALYDARVTDTRSGDDAGPGLRWAARVVTAGRGVEDEAGLELARQLATAIDAELAATRPLTEGRALMPTDRYIGLSGAVVAPDLYFAVGVSGADYHMRGVLDARVIAAVNSDPHAEIFEGTDYGVVGDLREVIPAVLNELRAAE